MKLRKKQHGFTLIELLLVIVIIGILAGLVVAMAGYASDKAKRSRTEVMKNQILTAIESYHSKHGIYPPDNPLNPAVSQLFYELFGTIYEPTVDPTKSATYSDINGNIADPSKFGAGGFVNSTKKSTGDIPKNFMQSGSVNYPGKETVKGSGIYLLAAPVDWPDGLPGAPIPGSTVNPWHYNASNPVHNNTSFDLWVDLPIGKKIISINNWSH